MSKPLQGLICPIALVAAAVPTNTAPSIVERLNTIEAQGTSKESGLNRKANRPEFLSDLHQAGTSKESGLNLKANRPGFLDDVIDRGTSRKNGV